MTKKDFEMLAAHVKTLRLSQAIDPRHDGTFEQWVQGLALRLKKDNPSFDVGRFMDATR